MGNACAIERKIKSTLENSSYSLSFTEIESYDKVYRDCQKHADHFEELKLTFETSRADLVSVIDGEAITHDVYAEAISTLITNYSSNQNLDPSCLQIAEKHPYLLINHQNGSDLTKRLRPASKFIMLLDQTRNELTKLLLHLHSEKRMAKVENYEENAVKAGLGDFEKALGREIAKKNFYIMSNLVLEAKAYREELETTSKSLPKILVRVRETVFPKAGREKGIDYSESKMEAVSREILVE